MEQQRTEMHVPRRRVAKGIGVYVRKSTDKQGDLSLPAQERLIRAAIVDPSGQPVYRVYRDVLSGTRTDRAEYQQMLTDARAGRLTMVAFHKVNRFGRDAAEGLAAINELRKLGVEVRVADIPSLDIRKPEGMFVFSFLLIQGQYEVENLGSESVKGMQELAYRGGWPFAAPDGYVNCREHIGAHHRRCWIAVDRKRAAIIRLIFRWYARGDCTLRDIRDRLATLHERRIAQGKSGCLKRSGKPWRIQSLYAVLRNPFYVGEIVIPSWDLRLRGAHPAIIREATFARVQAVFADHRNGPLERHTYLLQGRLVREAEKGGFVPLYCTTVLKRRKHLRYYYRLEGRSRRHICADRLEAAVFAQIQQRIAVLGPEPGESIGRRMRRVLLRAQRQVHQQLDHLATQRKRLLHLGTTGRFSDAEIAGEMSRLTVETEAQERERDRLSLLNESQPALIAEWKAIIAKIAEWETISLDEQAQLIAELVDQVEVDDQGNIQNIRWSPIWDMLTIHERSVGQNEGE